MVRFLNTDKIDKETWLRARKKGITGTDAGAIAGMNPYKSSFSVYQEKVSEEVTEVEDNERMREGRDLEAYVAQRFTEATGLKTRRALAVFQNEKHPVLLADYDRLIVGQRAGLECKTVSPYAAGQWTNDSKNPIAFFLRNIHFIFCFPYCPILLLICLLIILIIVKIIRLFFVFFKVYSINTIIFNHLSVFTLLYILLQVEMHI